MLKKVNAGIKKSQKILKEVEKTNIVQSLPGINLNKLLNLWESLDNMQIILSFLFKLKTLNTTTLIMRLNLKISMLSYVKTYLIGIITLYFYINIITFLV